LVGDLLDDSVALRDLAWLSMEASLLLPSLVMVAAAITSQVADFIERYLMRQAQILQLLPQSLNLFGISASVAA
jgi:hypothetical protein